MRGIIMLKKNNGIDIDDEIDIIADVMRLYRRNHYTTEQMFKDYINELPKWKGLKDNEVADIIKKVNLSLYYRLYKKWRAKKIDYFIDRIKELEDAKETLINIRR